MSRTFILGTLATIAAISLLSVANGDEESAIGFDTVIEALEALKADSSASVRNEGGWTIVNQKVGDDRIIWSFTPEGHAAHPAAVKRTIFEKDGALYISLEALCQGPKPACDALIEQFKELNRRVQQSIRSGG